MRQVDRFRDDERFVMDPSHGTRCRGQLVVADNFLEELKAKVGN